MPTATRSNPPLRQLGIALTVLLAAATLFSATGKLIGLAEVEELLDDVGVDGLLRDLLPFVQIAGAAGAIAGVLRWARLGIAATIGLFVYYAGAVLFHLRADVDGSLIPAGYSILAVAAAAIRTRTTEPDRPAAARVAGER